MQHPLRYGKMNGMSGESQRWQGQMSDYPWEQDALQYIKARMPDAEPYRAWQTFTFTASSGHVREVDLFIATPGGLFLVEIKSHPGKAGNNGSTWIFRDGTRTRTIENPLHFTDQKAKELRGQLERAARQLHVREPIPRIEAAVFLSAENLRCDVDDFDEVQRLRVYGRDGLTGQTKLPGIWEGFLNQPPVSEKNRVTPTLSKQLPKILHKAGIARLHKIGRVGPYELAPKSFDAGPTWEDYLARNPSLPNDYARRIRVYLSEQTANDAERDSTRRAARREYLALQGISHDGIVRAEQYSDELLAGPAVVFRHGEVWQRLDQFMAAHGSEIELETRLEMIRQLAEALDHAHRRHLYHRALAARCVYVELDGRYPRLRIGDWQLAARPNGTNPTNPRTGTNGATGIVTALGGSVITHLERSAGPYLAPEFASPEAPPALLDVFGLGALSYLILTSQPPARSRELLGQRLQAEHALVPSSVADSIGPSMDALVRDATQIFPADRTESVRQFLKSLDKIEEELTAPDTGPEADPLAAVKGDEINGWTVERVLGKGSTSRALLVSRDDSSRVFKVALNESAARRLAREAEQIGSLTDSHVARLLDPPFDAGPPESRRKVISVEYVGDHTLADELRQHGPLTIHELERLGEDLFQALKFLDGRDIWHRDIKPDNLALRKLERKGRELVLFDFSLAGAPDTDLSLGTHDYLDPFLGTGRRDRYDQAAELYAAAVTLHEMASGELPSWGDDLVPSSLLDPGEEVQLAEDIFDPVLRDGLVEFFRIALHRDAKQRFSSLHAMTRAWTDIFRDLDTVPPLTTASTVDDDSEDAQARRDRAIQEATPGTALVAAGLSPYALSIAQQRLGVSTAGELARVPAKRITRLRGIGSVPRYELVRLSRQWRERFRLSEAEFSGTGLPAAENQDQDIASERTGLTPHNQAGSGTDASPEDLAHLSVDEVVRRLIPDSPPDLARVAGRAPAAGEGSPPAHPWADQREIAQRTGMTEDDVAAHLNRLRARWVKSVPALTPVRDDVVAVLADHGRILDWRQLAAGLLARRGSELGDSHARLALAAICVRAAVETEERRDNPRMVARRTGDRVLIALTGAGEEDLDPAADDLFAYAELLGEQADALAARDPLPGVTEIKQTLRDVDTADHATRLSDTDLVLLAAAASEKTAATARLELYPRDLSPERALKISQAGSFLGDASDVELTRRVRARFPELTSPPKPEDVPRLLRNIGYDTKRGTDGLLHALSATYLSGRSGGTQARGVGRTSSQSGADADSHAWLRLEEARRRGGFVAVKARISEATNAFELIAAMEGVTAVNVTAEFVRILREIIEAEGRPRWEIVLQADSEAAAPAAKVGFARLLDTTWSRLDAHVRAIGNSGIVLLHDATPLARYHGGDGLLAKLAVAARQSGEQPHGLWLLCPMQNPKDPPHLDDKTVGVIPGDAEQLVVPDGFGASQRRAS
jgi:serine/threonine protein kinase